MKGVKEPVRLRQKKLSGGNTSLYLDIYHNGRREYEFLKLYLIPERTKADKEQNRQTMQIANSIKAKRIIDIQSGSFDLRSPVSNQVLFFDFFEQAIMQYSEQSRPGRVACLRCLQRYENNKQLKLSQITSTWVRGFREWLDRDAITFFGKPLSQNSKVGYFTQLKIVLNSAYKQQLIAVNPLRDIPGSRKAESTRMYLTFEELQRLTNVECEYPDVKRAFLFSCLTGLRCIDVKALTWGDVQQQGDFTRIIFRQQKTKAQEYLDISSQAATFMGERGQPSELIFKLNTARSTMNCAIERWVRSAGINKKITFHSARHTFAVMMLDLGVDLYTVSKLLGHCNIATTQIYAKVLDKNKQMAVQKIPDLFSTKE